MALLPTKKITQLALFTPPLTGDEEFECVQIGNSRKVPSRAFVLPTDSLITVTGMAGSLPGSRQLLAGTGVQLTDGGAGGSLIIDIIGTGAVPADPTALVGLAAVNGVAPTWMRSDSAPALDVGISPTWTGTHTFQNDITITNVTPQVIFIETDAAADNRRWDWLADSEQFRGRARDDANALGNNWIVVDRTGIVIDSIALAATAITLNGINITDFGRLSQVNTWANNNTFNANVLISSAGPTFRLNETDAAANNRLWDIFVNAEQLAHRVVDDAVSSGVSYMTVNRTLNVVDSIAFAATAITLNGVNITDYARLSQSNVFTGAGPQTLSAAIPQLAWNETDAAANNRRWDIVVNSEQFNIRATDDAVSTATSFILVDRTLNVIDSMALTATVFSFTGTIVNPLLRQTREQYNAVVWAAGANNLDLSVGNLHRITLNGNVTLAFTNPPPNSTLGVTFTIFLLQDGTGSRTVTWPASVHWSDGVAPTLTTTLNRMDAVTLTTFDGGTTYYGGQVLANMVP